MNHPASRVGVYQSIVSVALLKHLLLTRLGMVTKRARLAEIYAWVGEYDEAFRLLDHLLDTPNGMTVPLLKLDPVWDPLRKGPRFQALIDKYGPKT